jgi:hypothetical protein
MERRESLELAVIVQLKFRGPKELVKIMVSK